MIGEGLYLKIQKMEDWEMESIRDLTSEGRYIGPIVDL